MDRAVSVCGNGLTGRGIRTRGSFRRGLGRSKQVKGAADDDDIPTTANQSMLQTSQSEEVRRTHGDGDRMGGVQFLNEGVGESATKFK